MKRSTALKHVEKIIDRLNKANGRFETPNSSFEYFIVEKAFLFGSVAKGSLNPSDVDILIKGKSPIGDDNKFHSGHCLAGKFSEIKAYQILRKGMRMIRFHDYSHDGNFADIPQTKVLIYPENKFVLK